MVLSEGKSSTASERRKYHHLIFLDSEGSLLVWQAAKNQSTISMTIS